MSYHIGINAQESVQSIVWTAAGLPDPFAAGGIHLRVIYNRGRVTVLAGPGNATALAGILEARLLPISFGSPDAGAVFGFTASTGPESQIAEVDNLRVTRLGCDDAAETARIDGIPAAAVEVGAIVRLDGGASSSGAGDPDKPLSFHWEALSSNIRIEGATGGPEVQIKALAAGRARVRLLVDDGECSNAAAAAVSFDIAGSADELRWIRGDCNGDGSTGGIADAITMLQRNFIGGLEVRCAAACDANGDGSTGGVADAITLLQSNFLGTAKIPAPYPACGPSTLETDAALGCAESQCGG
jgi:hypothetical protein